MSISSSARMSPSSRLPAASLRMSMNPVWKTVAVTPWRGTGGSSVEVKRTKSPSDTGKTLGNMRTEKGDNNDDIEDTMNTDEMGKNERKSNLPLAIALSSKKFKGAYKALKFSNLKKRPEELVL
jgi:hypothetical protein